MRATGLILLAPLACLALGGCASPGVDHPMARGLSSSRLVTSDEVDLSGDELAGSRSQDVAAAWEFGRNDAFVGRTALPAYLGLEFVEIVSRDRMRTINGRPSETSYTTNYTIQRRATN